MIKRALVLGAQVHALAGVHNDTDRMVAVHMKRGFHPRDIDVRREKAGSRASMLEGYDRLIKDSTGNDTAVVYYSGHGSFVKNSDAAARGPRTLQCIVPTDIDESTDDDFRGISAWELSITQAALTARTRNVTVILDCCHSSQMSRDSAVRDATPRALPHPIRLGLGRYFAALRAEHKDALDHLDPLANPDAVRMVACGQTESAYEYTRDDGTRAGAFTNALLTILEELGDSSMSWAAVGAAVRQRVLGQFPAQRPDVEGPVRRRVFSLTEVDARDLVPIIPKGDRFGLLAGRLGGISAGDVYGVMPVGSDEYQDKRAIARVSVTAVSATSAEASLLAWKNDHQTLPAEAIGIPVEIAAARRPVTIDAPASERARIEEAVAATRTLRAARPDEADTAVATLRLANGELTIADRLGPLFRSTKYPVDLDGTVHNLVNMGVAHGIRDLVGSHGVIASDVEIEWGTVEGGQPSPMPATGGSLALGDRIYIKIRNSSKRRLYAHVFNIDLRHRVSLLTAEAPSGVALEPGEPGHIVAEGVQEGSVKGFELSWPEELSKDLPRIDELVLIITTARTNLQALETQEFAVRAGGRAQSALGNLLAQLSDGETLAARASTPADDFLVCWFSYLLHPREGGMAGLQFAIDEEPLNQRGSRSARAWIRPEIDIVPKSAAILETKRGASAESSGPSGAIAIRLGDLVVESNRALLSADIRIDALICTLSRPEDRPYTAQTMRFARIKDGERLPLDNALLYCGPVREFVDICLWVSRDTSGSRALADLFQEKAASIGFRDAMTTLVGAAGAAAPWIAAVGASAVLARMAYDLILGVAGKTIGLYRTSFLSGERFGVGRHPEQALYRAQDFSFSLLIDPVTAPPKWAQRGHPAGQVKP